LLFFCLPLFARENTDVIVMKNGDRITGQIKGLDAGVLYVSLPYVIQTLDVDWSSVAHLDSTQLFIVKAADGSVYRGTLSTAEIEKAKPVTIEVTEASGNESTIERQQVVQIGEASDKFWQRFNGEVNVGTTYTKGNQTVQFTLGGAAEYLRERWSAEGSWNSSLANSSGVTASTRNEVTGIASHLLPWNNYFYAGLSNFLQSSVQGIQLQSTVGAGIGRYLKNSNRATIVVVGGLGWQNVQYNQNTVGAGMQNLATALIAGEVRLFQFNRTSLRFTGLLMPILSEPGRVKYSMNSSYDIKITGNLSWNVSFYGNWQNQPPPHFQGSDYGTSSGLSWTFGMK
jgi:hypothetical protein